MFKYCYLLLLLVCTAGVGYARKPITQGGKTNIFLYSSDRVKIPQLQFLLLLLGQIVYFEDQFKNSVECVKKELVVGVPEWGIPPLDPWQSAIDFNLDNKYIR